jgi:hypothetical protein
MIRQRAEAEPFYSFTAATNDVQRSSSSSSGCPAYAADAEDGVPAEVEWTLDLVHDHHVHPDWAVRDTLQALVTPDAHGPGDNHFVVHLRVTDVLGQEDERTLAIYDRDSAPQAHLVEVSSTHVRPGQRITAVAHVDFALGQASRKQARMVFDWGDGSADVVAEARHHVDVERVHAYAAPGTYKLRLVAELDARQSVAVADIVVGPPRPAVAIFAPLDLQRWIPRAEQEAVVAELTAALATRTSEVRTFQLGEGADLAAWMDSLDGDSLQDVLVLLDFVPAPLLAGGVAGSPRRRETQSIRMNSRHSQAIRLPFKVRVHALERVAHLLDRAQRHHDHLAFKIDHLHLLSGLELQ